MLSLCFKICSVKVMLHVDANFFNYRHNQNALLYILCVINNTDYFSKKRTNVRGPTALTEQFSNTSLSDGICSI